MKRWWFLFLHNRFATKPPAQEVEDFVLPWFEKGGLKGDFCRSKTPDTSGNFTS